MRFTHLRRQSLVRPSRRLATFVTSAAALGVLLTACSSSGPVSLSSGPIAPGYPVTVSNCGQTITVNRPPTRAVSEDVGTLDMLALGLGPKLVGANVSDDVPVGQPPVPKQYMSAFSKVHSVPNDFTLESLVGLHPDFYYSGYGYGLEAGTNLTPAGLSKFGITTLALTESCAHVQPSLDAVTMQDTYQDIENLGAIFDVRGRADKLVSSMKAQVASVEAKVAGLPPVTVFDYDSGESTPFTGPGLAMPNAEISLAGGTNIFASLKQTWTTVSWEQVVAADPQCIMINDYGTPTAAQKEQFLKTSSITKNLTAVKNDCILAFPYDEITPSPLDAEAVVTLARWLHPAAFGLPPDGS